MLGAAAAAHQPQRCLSTCSCPLDRLNHALDRAPPATSVCTSCIIARSCIVATQQWTRPKLSCSGPLIATTHRTATASTLANIGFRGPRQGPKIWRAEPRRNVYHHQVSLGDGKWRRVHLILGTLVIAPRWSSRHLRVLKEHVPRPLHYHANPSLPSLFNQVHARQ